MNWTNVDTGQNLLCQNILGAAVLNCWQWPVGELGVAAPLPMVWPATVRKRSTGADESKFKILNTACRFHLTMWSSWSRIWQHLEPGDFIFYETRDINNSELGAGIFFIIASKSVWCWWLKLIDARESAYLCQVIFTDAPFSKNF